MNKLAPEVQMYIIETIAAKSKGSRSLTVDALIGYLTREVDNGGLQGQIVDYKAAVQFAEVFINGH